LAEIAITVPCYNEADRLNSNAFIDFVREHRHVTFIFVDDGSTDNTASLLKSISEAEQNNFRVIRFEKNQGKAEAVRQGTLSAIAADVPYVGYWDADLATPLAAVMEFAQQLKRNSQLLLVMGSRVRLLGRKIVRKHYRHYLGRIFATFASIILRLPVYDTQCGAKLFVNSEPVVRAFSDPFITRWLFDVEIIARLIGKNRVKAELAIYEYPLLEWQDVRGSKLRPKDFALALLDLARIHFRYCRD
jgi:glycosyltransferase involved in cell wall biosynthesis